MALEYKYDQGQIRVESSNSARTLCWALIIFLFLLNIAGAVWLYFSGYFTALDTTTGSGHSFATTLRGKMNEQKHLLVSRKDAIDHLSQELGMLQREQKIQVIANKELNKKLLLAEKRLSDADEELALYGNLLNAKNLKQGLHIQHFSLKNVKVDKNGKKVASNRRFGYHVVLSHIRSDNSPIKGSFIIRIIGQQKNKSLTLFHKDLVPVTEGTALTGFSLKYYQSLEGEIELPDGFTVKTVKLTISPSNGKTLEKTYDWAAVTANEN